MMMMMRMTKTFITSSSSTPIVGFKPLLAKSVVHISFLLVAQHLTHQFVSRDILSFSSQGTPCMTMMMMIMIRIYDDHDGAPHMPQQSP